MKKNPNLIQGSNYIKMINQIYCWMQWQAVTVRFLIKMWKSIASLKSILILLPSEDTLII